MWSMSSSEVQTDKSYKLQEGGVQCNYFFFIKLQHSQYWTVWCFLTTLWGLSIGFLWCFCRWKGRALPGGSYFWARTLRITGGSARKLGFDHSHTDGRNTSEWPMASDWSIRTEGGPALERFRFSRAAFLSFLGDWRPRTRTRPVQRCAILTGHCRLTLWHS